MVRGQAVSETVEQARCSALLARVVAWGGRVQVTGCTSKLTPLLTQQVFPHSCHQHLQAAEQQHPG